MGSILTIWYNWTYLVVTFGQISLKYLNSFNLSILKHNVRFHPSLISSQIEHKLFICLYPKASKQVYYR